MNIIALLSKIDFGDCVLARQINMPSRALVRFLNFSTSAALYIPQSAKCSLFDLMLQYNTERTDLFRTLNCLRYGERDFRIGRPLCLFCNSLLLFPEAYLCNCWLECLPIDLPPLSLACGPILCKTPITFCLIESPLSAAHSVEAFSSTAKYC